MPAPPREGCRHEDSLGYWTVLHNLLLYRLGWSRLDRGLRWWYDAGKPVDDPTLALVAEIWDRDDRLDGYLAWLLSAPKRHIGAAFERGGEPDELTPGWQQWLRQVTADHDERRYPWFGYAGTGDDLHLTRSGHQSRYVDPDATITVTDATKRTAVFVGTRADCWHHSLTETARTLPPIGARSWHVGVVVKPIGFMGIYRQSRDTGLWFTGRHRVHTPGN